ncbi:hypothetical protein PV04_02876 [Phialophora macrospora]|uniref:SRR1-like domain-containing protein n=1 Tax=Phialophora macrospora TaxID=1851006 RepID=A0A0D2FQM3_9EURO|nr:hypothetical protein PV04_02876 [Phialophora macrospora]
MPHTSHRKKKHTQNKRTEILDEDGWTRITSTSASAARNPSTTPKPEASETSTTAGHHQQSPSPSDSFPPRAPMPPMPGSKLSSMLSRFDSIEIRWQATDLCKTLVHVLEKEILKSTTGQAHAISTCVMLGSGSFCGDAVHWIDRHDSAYFQLAAFRTVVHTVGRLQDRVVRAYAQEPNFNDLDVELLDALNVTKVDHPRGFELLDGDSAAYSPAAEREVEAEIMTRRPRVWLHRSLDHLLQEGGSESELAKEFAASHENLELPALDVKNFPFHGSVIWWRKRDRDQDPGQDHVIGETHT